MRKAAEARQEGLSCRCSRAAAATAERQQPAQLHLGRPASRASKSFATKALRRKPAGGEHAAGGRRRAANHMFVMRRGAQITPSPPCAPRPRSPASEVIPRPETILTRHSPSTSALKLGGASLGHGLLGRVLGRIDDGRRVLEARAACSGLELGLGPGSGIMVRVSDHG